MQAARLHVDAASELAPRLLQTIQLEITQDMLEGNYKEALDAIVKLHDSDPIKGQLRAAGLETEARQGLRKQIGDSEYLCRWDFSRYLTPEERAAIQCGKQGPSGS